MATKKNRTRKPDHRNRLPTWLWPAVAVSLLLVVFVAGVLLGQVYSPDPAAPVLIPQATQTHKLPQTNIPTPHATIPLELVPEKSPEPRPVLTLLVSITDAQTGKPVQADIWVNGLKAVENVTGYDISLRLLEPGQKTLRLRVEADGYEAWENDVRFKILYSRRVPLLIELEPLLPKPDGDSV